MDEPEWATAPPSDGFLQRDPDQGQPATEPTEMRILFDDHALYVGVRLFDSEPSRISRQLSRRDAVAEADTFTLYLDPQGDRRTGVLFQVSAAGVQRDAAIYDDIFEDDTWDAVWESAVSTDADGWTLEMRIPLSQLRFPRTQGHFWGINARRIVYRKNENSWLVLVPKNETGLASRMAVLEGLDGVKPGRRLELLPYASTRFELIEPSSPEDPFNDGSRAFGGTGLDFKYGIGTGMTLVGAINPDFGQVEVDPAVVNLTAFETFFEEKRPFFTEGSQIFLRFGRSGASDYTTFYFPEPILFYSRRIGRTPQGSTSGDFVDTPASTTILGATKLVGRARGWNLGVLEALTDSEEARVMTSGTTDRIEVEPLTNYFVARAQRDLGRRAGIGFFGSSVFRRLDTASLENLLVDQAGVGGVDGHFFLDAKRDWVVFGGLSGSNVTGSPDAIMRLQKAPQRYYQRPDAPHVKLDPGATAMSGWAGRVGLNKNSGNVTVNAGLWGISPGFEANDMGYATQTDRAGGHGMILFRKLTPDRWSRTRRLSLAKWWTWNYGRESQGNGIQVAGGFQLLNYWQFDATFGWSWNTWDDKLTRGGPTTIRPGIKSLSLIATSDLRRPFWLTATAVFSNREFGSRSRQFLTTLNVRPFAALTLSATPSLFKTDTLAQYLATIPDLTAVSTYDNRYVFGQLKQTEVAIPLRANLVLSPKLSVQLYTQALLSAGDFPTIRELAEPNTFAFPIYGTDLGSITRNSAANLYTIDPDSEGPASPFSIPIPDFNQKSLRVNAVLRWEFRPGSAIYAVWTERRRDLQDPGDFSFGSDLGHLLQAPADDVFLVKIAWWIGK